MDLFAAVLVFAIFASGTWERWTWKKDREVEREQWRDERRELINRVQHPHVIPTGQRKPTTRTREPRDAAALAAVGRVQAPTEKPE